MSKSNKTSSWFVYYRYNGNSSETIDAQCVVGNIPYSRLTVSAIEYIHNYLRSHTGTDSVIICNIIRVCKDEKIK